jgi:16S rRNA (cytosine967-C5)-methyltransferase
MKYSYRRIENILNILSEYQGDVPLDNHLRKLFKNHKNWGSKDRRVYRECCFAYYRYFANLPLTNETITMLYEQFEAELGFISEYNPYTQYEKALSENIVLYELGEWFKQQAPLYITGSLVKLQELDAQLTNKDIEHSFSDLLIEVNSRVSDQTFPLINELQIMDKGSVETCANLPINKDSNVWDCCSGGGGKSLEIMRRYSPKSLVASDIRKKSLSNLQKRAVTIGRPIQTKVIDASTDAIDFKPNFIFIDAPCSGSGTWRRNPDRSANFTLNDLGRYTETQEMILLNTSKNLQSGDHLVYVTCSVFKDENENQVKKAQEMGLELLNQGVIGGFSENSDYFYRAVFKKK